MLLVTAALMVLVMMFSLSQGRARAQGEIAAEKWFMIKIKGEQVGYLHVVRKASGDASAPILFEHESLVDSKKDRARVNIQTYCEDDPYYSPVKATAQIKKPDDKTATLDITTEKKAHYGCYTKQMRLVYKPGKKKYELDEELPPHTVTKFSLMEIIPRLPFTEGPVAEFNFLDLKKMKVKKNHKIFYLGLEKIKIKGEEKELHKFEQKGSGIKKVNFWVDDNHQLLRVLIDKKEELLLSTKAEAFKPTPDWSRPKKEKKKKKER